MRREGTRESTVDRDSGGDRGSVEQHDVVGSEPPEPILLDLRPQAAHLELGLGDLQRATLSETAIDGLGGDHPSDLVDSALNGLGQVHCALSATESRPVLAVASHHPLDPSPIAA